MLKLGIVRIDIHRLTGDRLIFAGEFLQESFGCGVGRTNRLDMAGPSPLPSIHRWATYARGRFGPFVRHDSYLTEFHAGVST